MLELDAEPILDANGQPELNAKGQPKLRRNKLRRGGFASKHDAETAADEAVTKARKGVNPSHSMTVGEYLTTCLASGEWSDNTDRSHEQHCRTLWIPQLGRFELSGLRRGDQVKAALNKLDESTAT